MKIKILILDNYDSFTYNLVQIFRDYCNCDYHVLKNDIVDLGTISKFDKILFSPGAGIPSEVKIMQQIVNHYQESKSILGICLGFQSIAQTYKAKLINLPQVFHGIKETIEIVDKNESLFYSLPSKFSIGLYHSWAIDYESFPDDLKITAINSQNTIMAISHKFFDVKGIQFHPESFMTENGIQIIKNWLEK